MTENTNGWNENKKLILHELKQFEKGFDKIDKRFDKMEASARETENRLTSSIEKLEKSVTLETEANTKDIITLKVNAAKWGAFSGVVATVLIKLLV